MKLFTPRLTYFYAFLSIVGIFALALYLEYFKGVNPCPLCILQRVFLGALGITFFIGFVFAKTRLRSIMIGISSVVFSLCGALLAGRQAWIQYLPANQSADCGVSLQYMLHVLPIDQVVKKIFQGTAECSRVDWSFLSLSMAQWSLVSFIIFGIFSAWQATRKIP